MENWTLWIKSRYVEKHGLAKCQRIVSMAAELANCECGVLMEEAIGAASVDARGEEKDLAVLVEYVETLFEMAL